MYREPREPVDEEVMVEVMRTRYPLTGRKKTKDDNKRRYHPVRQDKAEKEPAIVRQMRMVARGKMDPTEETERINSIWYLKHQSYVKPFDEWVASRLKVDLKTARKLIADQELWEKADAQESTRRVMTGF